jgi:hypothetical protein
MLAPSHFALTLVSQGAATGGSMQAPTIAPPSGEAQTSPALAHSTRTS